jgi:photosystem II stability/assembly factor-like uncharacterized protein
MPLFALLLCLSVHSLGYAQSYSKDYLQLPALTNPGKTDSQLLALAHAGSRLVTAGERGLILYSDDEGQNWQQARVPVSQTLTALTFVGSEHGWAVGHGGVILHSGDGGASWQLQFDGNEANRQWLAYAQDQHAALEQRVQDAPTEQRSELEYQLEDAAFAVEDAQEAITKAPADPFLDVWFANENLGFAVGAYGMLYKTENSGLQWRLAISGISNPDRFHYNGITANQTGKLFISGEAGLLYRSEDRGVSWQRLALNYDGSLFGVLALGPETVLCYGLRGNVFRSDDSGDNWAAVPIEGTDRLSLYAASEHANGNIVLVGAGGALLSSSDSGRHFVSEIHSSRYTFSAVTSSGDDLLLTGMSGLLRIPAAGSTR